MDQPFTEQLCQMADSMGIALYQRFSQSEASLFLRCPLDQLEKLQRQGKISYIQLTKQQTEFFGYQLLEYLQSCITTKISRPSTQPKSESLPDRIMRSKEVQEMTGLSRTTIWRLERVGKFPDRVPLGLSSVGWRLSEVEAWVMKK